jgi:signal transduction histidine kinase
MLLNARQIEQALGKEKIILLAIEDITERKASEEEINKRNEQLIKLNAEKDKFFSIIAHDLKAPFQGFLNLSQIMTEEASSFSADELTEFGTMLNKTANNVFDLLKNLLEWSQMQQGSMSFEPKELSYTNLILNNIRTISERSKQKGIEIINEVIEPIDIYADENMINSVLLNLLSNSVKFSNRGSTVTVKPERIENDIVEISISDTGIGMKQNIADKLFKVGEDVGRVGTDGEKSTGLGLLLCKEFVEKHGGKIWVESEEGIGSRFVFTLPLVK